MRNPLTYDNCSQGWHVLRSDADVCSAQQCTASVLPWNSRVYVVVGDDHAVTMLRSHRLSSNGTAAVAAASRWRCPLPCVMRPELRHTNAVRSRHGLQLSAAQPCTLHALKKV